MEKNNFVNIFAKIILQIVFCEEWDIFCWTMCLKKKVFFNNEKTEKKQLDLLDASLCF